MNAPIKKPAAVETTIDGDVLTLTFANGEILALDAGKLSIEIRTAAVLHGLKQKLVDAAAISRDPLTGRAATVETKYHAVKEVFDRITAPDGTWNKTREGGGAAGGLLLQALVRMYSGRQTVEQLRAFLAGKSEAEKAALRKNSRIAAIIEEIKAERGGADGVDVDELLAELEGEE